jgi:acyl-coenzyme A thioesterase 13
MTTLPNFDNLQSLLDGLPRLHISSKPNQLNHPNDDRFRHPFSEGLGLKIQEVASGHVKANLKAGQHQSNRHGAIHEGLLATAADAAMAAVAQSNAGKNSGKVEVVKDLAVRFHEPVLPGKALEIVSKLDGSANSEDGKEIKFITSEIRQGSGNESRLVAQALATYDMLDPKDYHNLGA